MNRYYAFYTYAYGMRAECKEFDDEESLLAFIKLAKEPDNPYWKLRVIWGEELEFEPATFVESYRVKDRTETAQIQPNASDPNVNENGAKGG